MGAQLLCQEIDLVVATWIYVPGNIGQSYVVQDPVRVALFAGFSFRNFSHHMVLVTPIWPSVIHIWQLFSRIIGETLYIIRHIWRNRDWADTIDVLQKEG
jgi:hypothetical protein